MTTDTRPHLFAMEWQETQRAPSAPPAGRRIIVWSESLGRYPDAGADRASVMPLAWPPAREEAAARALVLVRHCLLKPTPVFLQVVLGDGEAEGDLALAVEALLRTAEAESGRVGGQVLIVAPAAADALAGLLAAEACCPGDRLVRHDGQRRMVRRPVPVVDDAATAPSPWRDGGIYLISGGLGGLGLAFAQDIASHAVAPVVILAGRSAPDDRQRAVLAGLEGRGARVVHRAVDVADDVAVAEVVRWAEATFGPVNGVLHTAGVLRDGFLAAASETDVEAVLGPKYAGAVALDAATRECRLDLFAGFSSLAGITGNPGQASYAMANAMLDGFIVRRAAMVAAGVRFGRSLSVNWPLWREGGMRVDEATAAMLRTDHGLEPLTTEDGLRAFAWAVAAGPAQVAVACGEPDRLIGHLAGKAASRPAAETSGTGSISRRAVVENLRALVSSVTKHPAEAIDALEPFEAYGIDSIMITALNERLGRTFGTLPKALLFEHRTLDSLAGYLTERHAESCADWLGGAAPSAPRPAGPSPSSDRRPLSAPGEPIAIVGMSGRFPEAADLDTFWRNLAEGRDCITEIPADRWPLEGFYEPDRRRAVAEGKSYSKWGGFLAGFADFDPLFFGISPREAQAMDPQERLFLEIAWETLEDAALSPVTLAQRHGGRVGVFAGITKTGFDLYRAGGVGGRTSFASVANRVSYVLDLCGPSVPVDTMCSSSLTAVHQACQSLRLGECDLALAGGVNLYLHPSSYVDLCATGMLAEDGRCRSFGRGGTGFVPGEGVGCVLLAPLSLAEAEGMRILAVVRGSAVNHGGHTHGYTVPSPTRQRDVVRAALDAAGADARSISYVEAHGTGTELGDPVEIEGLAQAFRADTPDHAFCAIGSVKSAIGHLEAAAGIAGLIKTVLQMRHNRLAPSLHAEETNPNLDLNGTPFVLQRRPAPWPVGELPRRATVSSFGAGGANACVVIEESPRKAVPVRAEDGPQAVLLSARNPEDLAAVAGRLRDWLAGRARADDPAATEAAVVAAIREMFLLPDEEVDDATSFAEFGLDATDRRRLAEALAARHVPEADVQRLAAASCAAELAAALAAAGRGDVEADLAALAWTLQSGRQAFDHRLGFRVVSTKELAARLDAFLAGEPAEGRWWQGRAEGSKESRAALAADRGVAAAIGALLAARDLERLVALWTRGLAVDWRALHGQTPPRPLGLPTYPFAHRRLWFDQAPKALPVRAMGPAGATPPADNRATATEDEVRAIVQAALAERLDLCTDDIVADLSFADYGLDSILCVGLVDDLNGRLGIQIETTTIFDHSSLDRLCRHIGRELSPTVGGACPAPVAVVRPAAEGAADPIAVIGMSGRFPGAPDVDALWQAVADGRDLVGPVERWPLPPEVACRSGGFLADIDRFDALFFNISGVEAAYIDPQQRLFLEESWKALEDAGYTGNAIGGRRCGVYVGCCGGDYQDLIGDRPSPQSLWGNMASVIPGRVAYCLDLKGPVLAVDTACSSSLVAIHAACRDLRSGEAEMALAGGVFVQTTPKLYLSATRAGMLSPFGRCRAFDHRADGFVPAEGVGVLVLKPLSAALRDGDHVHGVILGSGVNHDGTTNGITAPSAESQAALLRQVHAACGIEPAAVGLLEAHGTGTALGDPIEYQALNRVFSDGRAKACSLALGSIKTNIGHAQFAAGVAGAIKILLALRHRTIPPTVHFEAPNPRIDLHDGPCRVPTAAEPWPARGAGRRIGAVSSFGASGTNAHVVIAEPPSLPSAESRRPPFLVALSARSEAALRDLAGRLADHCRTRPDLDCADVAYSLAVGRKAFEHRLAVVVDGCGPLADALAGWQAGKSAHGVVSGCAGNGRWDGVSFDPGVEGEERRAAMVRLAGLFVEGAALPVEALFAGETRRRIPLPVTAFADTRYWLPEERIPGSSAAAAAFSAMPGAVLRPLSEDGTRRVYALDLRADGFPLSDHRVRNRPVLPGVAIVTLLHQALPREEGRRWRIDDLVWARPIAPAGGADSHRLVLTATADDGFACEVSIGGEVVASARVFPHAGPPPAPLDLAGLADGCPTEVSATRCYDALGAMGIVHGTAMRALARMRVGANVAVADLVQPANGATPEVSPAMLDTAIQASVAFLLEGDGKGPRDAVVPFSIASVDLLGPCEMHMTAVLRGAQVAADGVVSRLDVDLCDPEGTVRIRMRGLTSRRLREGAKGAASSAETLLLKPIWEPLDAISDMPGKVPHTALQVGSAGRWEADLAAAWPDLRPLDLDRQDLARQVAAAGEVEDVVWIAPSDPDAHDADGLIAAQEDQALGLLRLLRVLVATGADARPLRWTVITEQGRPLSGDDPVRPAGAGVHGLFGSLAKEYPHWRVRICDLQSGTPWPVAEMAGLPVETGGSFYARRHGVWHRPALVPLHAEGPVSSPYREGGVYVVIGGAGGVGGLWTEAVVRRCGAQVVWVGRRPADAAIETRLDTVAGHGPRPFYLRADAADAGEMERVRDEVLGRFGRIDGLVHAALALHDRTLTRMDDDTMRRALRAKVDTAVRLAQVFDVTSLDFVLFFSSIQSFACMPGQGNYAAGCTFADSYARLLAQGTGGRVRVMNWGWWDDVGAAASDDHRARMARAGLAGLKVDDAIAALDRLLTGRHEQLALVALRPGGTVEGLCRDETVREAGVACPPVLDAIAASLPLRADGVRSLVARVGGQMDEMDEAMVRLAWVQMKAAGLFEGDEYDFGDLAARLPPLYGGEWLRETLRVLARHGYVTASEGGRGRVTAAPELAAAEPAWRFFHNQAVRMTGARDFGAHVRLVEIMLRALPDILGGRRRATDVMFPRSSLELVEGIYRDNPVADHFNAVLCDGLEAAIEARLAAEPGARIRLLEVGAGTGGTSLKVFDRLRRFGDGIAEYCYTDVSKAFLLHAERVYRAAAPYLTTCLFDVERPVDGQSVAAGAFDIAIAANVLHATRAIRPTLRNVKATLKQGGLLLLNELSVNVLFSHLTFGLLEGWWKYDDPALRLTGSPALAPESWRRVLESEGFRRVAFLAGDAERLGQQIVACDSDGVVRQWVDDVRPGVPSVAPPPAEPAADDVVAPSAAVNAASLRDGLRHLIRRLVAETVQVPEVAIEFDQPLERYGVDSILVLQITARLREVFADVSSTLLFEVNTIRALADHFLASQPDAAQAVLGARPDGRLAAPAAAAERTPAAVREETQAPRRPATERHDIAIIGLSGRYAGAEDLSQFWTNLVDGRDCIGEIPPDRFDWRVHFDERRAQPGKIASPFGGFIDGADRFDPLFFRLSAAEAERMDPQERLFLEEAWHAIEHAGYNPRTLGAKGRVGVFAGVSTADYATGAAFWSVANRVSFLLDLKGPSLALDTACSSSLTAVHLAVESLRAGSCDMAVVGGVNLILRPRHLIALSELGMLSTSGRCRAFGADADGFVDGEGVGAALLRPLEDAIADGDSILAVIAGTAINAGGRTSSYTAPSSAAQADVILAAWQDAGVDSRAVGCVEAHGTGTALGDPIEIEGLVRAFRAHTADTGFCALGSVKSNIGHCESAAGIASLTKAVLQMQKGVLVPTLHADRPNPHLDLASTPLVLQRQAAPWVRWNGEPRLASVSSFGAGGANAHVTLREHVPDVATQSGGRGTPPRSALLVLSARTPELLRRAAAALAGHLKERLDAADAAYMADVAFTLQTGRDPQGERLAIVATGVEEAVARLEAVATGEADGPGLLRGTVHGRTEDDLAADDDFRALLRNWAAKGEWRRLGELWVNGMPVDWLLFHGGWKPNRVPLPGSPFERQRYWLDVPADSSTAAERPAVISSDRAASTDLAAHLRDLVGRELNVDPGEIGVDVPLAECGLDSLAILRLTARLEETLGAEVGPSLFFEHRTLSAIARWLADNHPEAFSGSAEGDSDRPTPAVPASSSGSAVRSVDAAGGDDIAIIGLGGSYPQAPDLETFWRNLREGRDCITEIPQDRWDHAPFLDAGPEVDGSRCRWGGFLDGVDRFDARFFGMLPEDAERTDPQERLFVECVFRAMENAGHCPASLAEARAGLAGADVGVYVAVMAEEYPYFGIAETARGRPTVLFGSPSSIANRVSYLFGFQGPSIAVDTMCSGSLTALHLACQALRDGDCRVAVAGGVNLSLHPNKYLAMGRGGFDSPTGRCAAFGEGGDGYVPAEGVGAVILKPLTRALADGDRILGIVKATGINHGGRTNGFTVPDPAAQAALIEETLARAGVAPRSIGYVEAHGTGTLLGDPVEIAGLSRAFGRGTADIGFCAIGSVKSAIGHCESAAGIAGLTKVLLQMQHRELVPTLHTDALNPHIDFAATPFVVQRRRQAWRAVDGQPLRAAISSFGAGGSNAHVVIEEAPARPPGDDDDRPQLVALSARTPAALMRMAGDAAAWLTAAREPFADLAYTLQSGREGYEERLAFVAASAVEAAAALSAVADNRSPAVTVYRGRTRRGAEIAFDGGEKAVWPPEELARRWAEGAPVDWRGVWGDRRRRRVLLPPYPLEPQSYWHSACRQPPAPRSAAVAMMAPTSAGSASGDAETTVLLRPEWRETAPAAGEAPSRLVLLCGLPSAAAEALRLALGDVPCHIMGTEADDPAAAFGGIAMPMLTFLRDLLGGASRPGMVQMVAPALPCEAIASGLAGLVGALVQEVDSLRCQVIAIDPAAEPASLVRLLADDATSPDDRVVRRQGGRREVRRLAEIPPPPSSPVSPWRDGGCYLITGGLGGLGRIFARAIAEGATRPGLILSGRSAPDAAGRAFLAELEEHGACAVYHPADVADTGAMAALVARARAEFGGLTGVLHSAGLIRDSLLVRKDASDASAVLAPKVAGAMALDQATRDEALDFFACFASLAGVTGNVGQADYAMGNGFLDGFAAWRNRLVATGHRRGRTLAIDWPLWADGGMTMPPAMAAQVRESFGLTAMPVEAGLAAFARALTSGESQVVVAHGLRERILKRLDGGVAAPSLSVSPSSPAVSEDAMVAMLVKVVAADLRLSERDVALDQPLGEFGFDSIGLTRLAGRIGTALGTEIPPTVLFGFPTLGELARHLVAEGAAVAVPTPLPTPVRPGDGAIAIVGVSAAFPGAADMDAFWANLVAGRDCIIEVPSDRWDWRAIWGDPIDRPGCTDIKWGGFMDGVAEFDARFFGISPREAELIDPQHRLLMTHVWRAIEESGHAPSSLAGSRTAVYLAVGSGGYASLIAQSGPDMASRTPTGGAPCIGPNRISYALDLRGPSEPVDTACSSSLVAVHRGVEAIRRGEATLAIVGGVNLMLTPAGHVGLSRAGMLSRRGRCRTFTWEADGYARGEGVGVFVLKPLRAAEADGDHIHAVIRASGVNHGGRANSLTAPNPLAQADLLTAVYRDSGIDPRTVTYMEAHGTGTALGDPVEMEGMTAAFRRLYEERGLAPPIRPHCGVGSVKTHIGHLEMAAGAASLAKVLLQLHHRTLVANLHAGPINPQIHLDDTPFHLVQTNQPWAASKDDAGRDVLRRAGISSFGYGGVNAHLVVEEYVTPMGVADAAPADEGPAVLVLSARNDAQLAESCRRLREWIVARRSQRGLLGDVAYTLQVGRDAMPVRLGVVVGSLDEAADRLGRHLQGEAGIPGLCVGRARRTGGVGTQQPPEAGNLEQMVQSWVAGDTVDWRSLHGRDRCRISLPTYPFARDRHWLPLEESGERHPEAAVVARHPLLQDNVGTPSAPRYMTRLSGREPFLRDHVVGGGPVLPGAAFLEMARAAVCDASAGTHWGRLCDIRFERFAAPGSDGLVLEIALEPRPDGSIAFAIGDGNERQGTRYCHGLSRPGGHGEHGAAPLDLAAVRARMTRATLSGADCRAALGAQGLEYGPSHHGLLSLAVGDGEVLADIVLPESAADCSPAWWMNPALLDAALQAGIGLIVGPDGRIGPMRAEVPVAVRELVVSKPLPSRLCALVGARSGGGMDVTLCAEDGTICARVQGFRTFPIPASGSSAARPVAQASTTLDRLVALLSRTIGIAAADIDSRAALNDLGLDAVAYRQFAQAVAEAFEIRLSAAEVATAASLEALARRLDDAIAPAPGGLQADPLDRYWQELAAWTAKAPLSSADPPREASTAEDEPATARCERSVAG